jgi:membrane dipeptidase
VQPVFDGHNDALSRIGDLAVARQDGAIDLPRMRAGGLRGAIFAVHSQSRGRRKRRRRRDGTIEWEVARRVSHGRAAAEAAAQAGRLLALERAGGVRVARRIADIDAARDGNGPPAAVLHLEGAEAIDPQLEALETWYAAGLRSLGPVWSRPNDFGHGVQFVSPSGPDIGPGLTPAGEALVRRCGELGVLVDLSHLNEAGFWDVARLEAGPLVASHSGAHRLAAASRNLTNRQLDAIGESGGLVGIVFACPFLRSDFADDPETPLELIVDHARYVAERIGINHVGLGSDFDGATMPATLTDAAGLPRLIEALGAGGFTRDEIDAIAWTNWRRVLAAWWR